MKTTCYLTVKPKFSQWRKDKNGNAAVQSLKVEKVTTKRPTTGSLGSAVVKVTLDIPEHVFVPFEVDAAIDVHAEEVGKIRVVVEPFTEHDFTVVPDPS